MENDSDAGWHTAGQTADPDGGEEGEKMTTLHTFENPRPGGSGST